MKYLSVKEVLRIHYTAIKQFGGSLGIRDLGLIESAVARPQIGFGEYEAYADIFAKAAVLTYSLIKNHGFIDGNKRTAMMTCGLFLLRNGYHLKCSQKAFVETAGFIATDSWDEERLSAWLKEQSESRSN